MKQIVNRPFLLALFLSLPLWVVFGNYVVAAIVALLLSFLISMANALRVLRRGKADTAPIGARTARHEPDPDTAMPGPAETGERGRDIGPKA